MLQLKFYKKLWWFGSVAILLPTLAWAVALIAPGVISGPSSITVNTPENYSVLLYATEQQEELQAVFDWGDGSAFGYSSFITPSINGVVTSPIAHAWVLPGQYYIKAQARDKSGNQSPWSQPFLVYVSASEQSTAPATPTNLQANSDTAASISLSWQDNSNNEVKFLIFRKPSTEDSWPASPHGQVGTDITFFTDTYQLIAGNSYDYYVVACNSANVCSGWSNQVTVVAGSSGSNNNCTGFNLTTNKTSYLIGENLTYNWSCASGSATFVQIQLLKPDNSVVVYTTSQSPDGLGSYTGGFGTDNLLVGRHTLQACFISGCSTVSASINFDMIASGGGGGGSGDNTVPNSPSALWATAEGMAINLSWPAAAGASTYNVYRLAGAESDNWQMVFSAISSLAVAEANLTAGIYKYRLEACNINNVCSGTTNNQWAYSSALTIGGSTQESVWVTVATQNNAIIPSGLIALVYQNRVASAVFNYSASASIKLMPGVYELQPSFPGINSDQIQFSGSGVSGRQLNVGTTDVNIKIILPLLSSVNILVQGRASEPLAEAQVKLGLAGTSLYTSTLTNSAGVAWLQLAPGDYQGLVTKPGFGTQSIALSVTTSGVEKIIKLTVLPIGVSGQVLAAGVPKAAAAVQAYNPATGVVVVTGTDTSGRYILALDKGKWILSVWADGYHRSQGMAIDLIASISGRDLNLGEAIQLITTNTSIVPTASATVMAAELGVKVNLPANALGGGTSATVTVRQSSYDVATAAASPLAGTVRRVTAEHANLPVTNLAGVALLEFDYTEADLLALGVKAESALNLKLAFWQPTYQEWQVLDSVVDITNRKVRATTSHFTIFAIVLPFLVQPAGAQVSPSAPVPEAAASRTVQFNAILAEGTKVYVSSPEALALSVNTSRNLAWEQKYESEIVLRVLGSDTPTSGVKTAIVNFVTYGTGSTVHLGAGERGGVVSSWRAAYGRLPASEYDWQEVLKIANGRWPGTLLPERELAMTTTFKKIYLREVVVTQPNDSAALAIMAYGLRSAKRNLVSESAASSTFRAIYGYAPTSATDWDAVRAVAYSGAKR